MNGSENAPPTLPESSRLGKTRVPLGALALVVGVAGGCRDRDRQTAEPSPAPSAAASNTPPPAPATAAAAPPEAAPSTCPAGMIRIEGKEAWFGSAKGKGAPDESPRFRTRLASFCLDETEVTRGAYQRCVDAGSCKPARSSHVTCSASRNGRDDWPINCITWHQAKAFCEFRDARLPTELEWEYAASGGDDRTYSWGDEAPDDRTCWKDRMPCAVKSFPPGAFGLYDMTGNVWEWTADYYGDYPWPALDGAARVYRGGSWSRRFEKWMRVRLRNRWSPRKEGSHLGVRCAKSLEDERCPFGVDADGGGCALRVMEIECEPGTRWNGVRCTRPGAARCPAGTEEVLGHGCTRSRVLRSPTGAVARGEQAAGATPEGPEESGADVPVTRSRSPEFDADCAQYQPARPHAYRFEGGTHADRTASGKNEGCKNRDVGVGWNSSCCP